MSDCNVSFRLDGRRALVSGGTDGIGAAIARGLAASGADVCVIGLKADDAANAVLHDCRSAGATAELLTADLSLPPQQWLPDLMENVERVMPGIDTLVNNVGTYIDLPFLEMTAEIYSKTMNLNVASGYFMTQYFARRWVEDRISGRVLFTGSINGFLSEPDHTAYDTSKGAVAAMVRSLCVSLAPMGIRINSIAPGLIRTPLTAPAIDSGGLNAWMKLHTPNGQVPEPEACVGGAIFLLSDAAAHVHGQTLLIDGGMSTWQQPNPPALEKHS